MNNYLLKRPAIAAAAAPRRAFTLIEMLVVIAIIGILASLVLYGAGIGTVKARRARAETERQALIMAIEAYKSHKGFYPPDNTNQFATQAPSALFYELTGGMVNNGTFTGVTGEQFSTSDLTTLFGQGGIVNSTSDQANNPVKNYFSAAGKSTRTAVFTYNGSKNFTAFGLPLPPGTPVGWTQISGASTAVWNYNSSNPTNNPSEFDLWIDLTWSGKTNRISNWSKDPQTL